MISNYLMVNAQSVSDILTACMMIYLDQFQNFIDFFNEGPAVARQIFHIQIFTKETFKPSVHATINNSILIVNSIYLLDDCNALYPFYSENCHMAYFFRNFTYFQTFTFL